MAFSALNPPRLLLDTGLYSLSPLDTSSSRAAPNLWGYIGSTDSSSDISATTGYFAACGYGSRNNSAANVGMRVGDMVLCVPSTNASVARGAWLTCIASTADQASTTASTGAKAAFNVTASS